MSYLRTVRRRISEPTVKRSVSRILRDTTLCSMATVGPGNRAHINTAYFCHSDDLELFFISDPESLHCQNLKDNPSMAVMVFRTNQTWGTPNRGMQLFGSCREAKGRAAAKAKRLYGRRFPLYGKWLKAGGFPAAQLQSYRFYRFVPTRIKILDESVFGGAVFVVAAVRRGSRG